jgi:hypothetical protein
MNQEPDNSADERRRHVLRLAKFGAYSAPFMVAMLTAEKAIAQTGEDPCDSGVEDGGLGGCT